jgi:hypothetical protein
MDAYDDDYFDTFTSAVQSGYGQQSDRCIICTLPCGTCTHTRKNSGGILNETQRRKKATEVLTEIEQDIDDALGFLGDEIKIEAGADLDTVDINALSWAVSEYRLSDKIDTTSVALSVPEERGWHTVTNIGNRFLVVFGGISYRYGVFGSVP